MSPWRSIEPFTPHPFEEIEHGVFPVPVGREVYEQWKRKYENTKDINAYRITYDSDGLVVTGAMVVPAEIPAGGLPLLIFNRGGNRRYGMLTLLQIMGFIAELALKGYVVLAPNYRGNDGGEGQEDFGGEDVNDVLNLLALGKQLPEWDGKNCYMAGWSRGGIQTYVSLKHGAEVQAAGVIAGVTDLRASIEDRPDMLETVYKQLLPHRTPEEFEQAMDARSALRWPEQLRIPLIIFHGDADDKVHVREARNLAAKLEALDHPHRYVEYAGGNHGLAAQRRDMFSAMDEWFRRHRR